MEHLGAPADRGFARFLRAPRLVLAVSETWSEVQRYGSHASRNSEVCRTNSSGY
jgi:hypothetical protein